MKRFGYIGFILLIAVAATDAYSQGSIQRTVRISNANGKIITLMTGNPLTDYPIIFPPDSAPSNAVASVLFGFGNGQWNWTSALNADSGSVLMLGRQGGLLVPQWAPISSIGGGAGSDEPLLTFAADNGSLTNNRVLSVGPGLSITNSGADDGSIVIGNTGVLKLTAGPGISLSDSTGNITITAVAGNAWGLTGNSGTTAGTNFIGTTDSTSWVVKTNNTERMRVAATGDIGINTTSPNVNLDINGDLAIREYNYTTSVSGSLNNINFDGQGNNVPFVRIASASNNFSLTGITGGVNGKMLSVYNSTAQTMTVVNQSTGSTVANRIITGTSANIPLPAGGTVNFLYSAQDQRWIVRSISGAAGWLYTGNSGLVDGVSNFHGTLDSIPIRFVSGNQNASGPRQRMILDPRGNLLFGANSSTATFTTGQGKLAFGDSLNTLRLNSLPTFGARVFNMIDPNAVVRVWRFNNNTGGTDPAVELIGGTNDLEINPNNTKWDFYTTGTPGVAWTGTRNQGEHFAIRRRTNGNDSVYMSVFAGSGARIGTDSLGTARYTPYKLAVLSHDQRNDGIMDLAVLEHLAHGTGQDGLGSGLLFRGETSRHDSLADMARVAAVWTTAAVASRSAAITFSTVENAGSLTEQVRIASNGYTGIGTTAPAVRLDVNGGYATRLGTINLSNGANNNVSIGDASFVRILNPTSSFTISGISGGSDGKRIRLVNSTGQNMTIANSSSSSSSSNRIITGTGADVTFTGDMQMVDLIYDASGGTQKWLMGTLAGGPSGGSGGSSTTILYAEKPDDETVSSSTTLQNDDDLTFELDANQTYEIAGELETFNNSNNIGIRIAVQVPSGGSIRVSYTGISDGGAASSIMGNGILSTSNTSETLSISGGTATVIQLRGIIKTGDGGTTRLRWAQGSSNSSSSRIRAGSFIRLLRVQ